MRLLPLRLPIVLLLSVCFSVDAHAQEEDLPLAWSSLSNALEQGRREGRPTLVYVQAPWCGPCRKMEREVFPEVRPLLERLARAELDYDEHEVRLRLGEQTRSPSAWARHFGVDATPGFVLLAEDGALITSVTGFLQAEAFGLLLAYVATGAYRHASFEDYVEQTHPGQQPQR